MGYCVEADLYNLAGLPRGALPNPARLAERVPTAANAIRLEQHGYALNDPITLRAEASGSLPAPLAEGTTYYAIPVTASAFSVAAAPNGSVIPLTTVGARVLVISQIPFEGAIAFGRLVIDQALPAHLVPLAEPVHELVRLTNAELAVGKLLSGTGGASKSLAEIVEAATKRIEKWGKGQPLRGDNVPPPANVAVSASLPYRDSRGWNRFGGL